MNKQNKLPRIKRMILLVIFTVLTLAVLPAGCGGPLAQAISGVSATPSSDTEVTVIWGTRLESSSHVEYGLTTAYGSRSTLDSAMELTHIVELTDLISDTTYHFCVISTNGSGEEIISDDYTFTTLETEVTLTISNCTVSDIKATSAVINWNTDLASNSQVEYGTTTSYGATTTVDIVPEIDHSVTLTGLTPNTAYHYRVKSEIIEDDALSEDYTFVTDNDINDNTIAFISYSEDTESADIYLVDLNGENLIRLTDDQLVGSKHKPVWSPEGDKIAFFSPSPPDFTDGSPDFNTVNMLHIMDYRGNDLASVDDIMGRGVSDPVWSPDANKIAFTYSHSNDDTFVVYMMNADGENLEVLDTVPGSPHIPGGAFFTPIWSPDSSKICVISHKGWDYLPAIYVIDIQGERLISLEDDSTSYPQPEDLTYYLSPQWSPDGSKLMFVVYDGTSSNIYVINSDGTGMIDLTSDNYGFVQISAWLQDNKIVFKSGIESDYVTYSINSGGTGLAKFPPDTDGFAYANLSPDGSKILLVSSVEVNGNREYYVMDGDSSDLTKLNETFESVRGYAWSPDSTKLIFTSFNQEKTETNRETTGPFADAVYDIYVINADGTGLINVASNMGDAAAQTFPQWFPDSKRIVFRTGPSENADICVVNSDGTGLINLTEELGHSWSASMPGVGS